MIKRTAFFVVVVLALPLAANAQSLFGTRGLGVPADGYDARARALGVNGVGLLGLSTSLVNPAEPAGTLRRGLTAAFQPFTGSAEYEGEEDDISATRFPMIRILYPTRLGVFSLGYSGVLDQSWAVIADGEELIGGDTVATRDLVETVGGVGQLRLGYARRLSERFALGLAVGIYTGNIDRGITRSYPDSSLLFREFETHSRWNYSAPMAAFGVRYDAGANMRVGGSITWAGTLKAKPTEGSETEYEYDMPLRFAVGASGRVARNLMATVSGSLTSWSSGDFRTPGNLAPTEAQQQLEIGGGIEYSELRRGDRVFPIRLGARTAKLPFHLADEEAPSEFAITGGIGLRLVEDDFGPLAVADVGVERVSREGLASDVGSLKENFWRFTVSISLFGR